MPMSERALLFGALAAALLTVRTMLTLRTVLTPLANPAKRCSLAERGRFRKDG